MKIKLLPFLVAKVEYENYYKKKHCCPTGDTVNEICGISRRLWDTMKREGKIEANRVLFGDDSAYYDLPDFSVYVPDCCEDKSLCVCERCLHAIESREGPQATERLEDDEHQCDWCESETAEFQLI